MTILILLDTLVTASDTLHVEKQVLDAAATSLTFNSVIDVLYKISMVVIAIFNIFYVIQLNRSQNHDKEEQRKKEHKIDLLKTLVLVPNLNKMYAFLDELWKELAKLKLEDQTQKNTETEKAVKEAAEPKIQSLFASFYSDFIIILNATTPKLGEKIQTISDTMRDTLLNNMWDEGINLWVTGYFNDKIKSVFEKGKKEMVSTLFDYDGGE